MSVKLVNLGLPKSGTTTLAHALQQAGWHAADHKVRRIHTKDPTLGGTFVGRQIYDGYYQGDPFKRLDLYDALTEINVLNGDVSLWPQCDYAVLKAMRLARPDMLFVATWRDPAEVADSMRRWNNLGTDRLPNAWVPGLPRGYGTSDAERIRWIEGHYDMLRDVFGDDPRYLQLDMAAEDARERLSAHIGEDLPWWGRVNVNTDNPATAPESGAV
ncbi:sulfotransferase [Tropicibacter naphthalenivorans]|uniref:Sulfotransferase family protein n=1 Tax=Tropicibacter naphthalenivorans TaxID=441103 RepID=A0A0N7LZ93_9RHOB|nr:sulfotransferase [Tropicibacter naphthalenivorans]CUH77025.1 hypothetical protein TRN7648_01254 [Tropicibacter naphthalenivorans]SMC61469.1 hypothetical protein SAMN04488093_102364 [Tropicibacter naphthalenivorans]